MFLNLRRVRLDALSIYLTLWCVKTHPVKQHVSNTGIEGFRFTVRCIGGLIRRWFCSWHKSRPRFTFRTRSEGECRHGQKRFVPLSSCDKSCSASQPGVRLEFFVIHSEQPEIDGSGDSPSRQHRFGGHCLNQTLGLPRDTSFYPPHGSADSLQQHWINVPTGRSNLQRLPHPMNNE